MNTHATVINFCLTVKIGQVHFGIDAKLVQEIVKLPAVSPLEEAPSYMQGLINLRGNIIPVMDLNLRLGHSFTAYRLTDVLVVLKQEEKTLGIIVNEVIDILELPRADITQTPGFHGEGMAKNRLISAVARAAECLILLLDQQQLFKLTPLEQLEQQAIEYIADDSKKNNDNNDRNHKNKDKLPVDTDLEYTKRHEFFQGMQAEEKQEFKLRAQQLQKQLATTGFDNHAPLAIIKLAGEQFAIELNATAGFAILARLTPIPCCPAHIVGSMNLRGDNLTIVDIRQLLNIPHDTNNNLQTQVMIIKCAHYSIGVSIDEVINVVYLHTESINKMPATTHALARQYFKGMVTYEQKLLAVVDLPKMLSQADLIVNEEV